MEIQLLTTKIDELEKRIIKLESKRQNEKEGLECNHQTIPWGVNKRKCGICGEVFIVDSD